MTINSASVVYYSASGTTKKVAEWIASELSKRGIRASLFALPGLLDSVPAALQSSDLIILGTPTYSFHTPPIVKRCMKSGILPGGKPYGIFATYGMVTIGSNLSWLSSMIRKRGGRIVAAMKIESEHAMMFKSDHPLAKGKPAESDKRHINKFVSLCIDKALSRDRGLNTIPGIMKYFAFLAPPGIARKMMPRISLDTERCTMCLKCVDSCPVGNISVTDGLIRHGGNCLLCYNCVKSCPESAVNAKLENMDGFLRLLSNLPDRDNAVY
ncbi:MAG: EFR1 family ferrodoxin [Spirochaetes bacterium]|nr:EFR1 family ferrodoxin [Spirochaetota bacterium]